MDGLQHLLVGIDFDAQDGSLTEGSRGVMREAARFCGAHEARARFLHSAHRSAEDPHASTYDAARGMAEFEAYSQELGFDHAELVVSQEPPWLALIHRVLSGGYDLVMVGKYNEAPHEDRSMGRVTMRLVRKCPCPVWVVHPQEVRGEGPVLAATEMGPVGTQAVERAAAWAAWRQQDLYVVHAWRVPVDLELSASGMSPEQLQKRIDAEMATLRERILAMPAVAALGERAHVVIREGLPSDVVVAAVQQVAPRLCVAGPGGSDAPPAAAGCGQPQHQSAAAAIVGSGKRPGQASASRRALRPHAAPRRGGAAAGLAARQSGQSSGCCGLWPGTSGLA